jgi:putative membrane protein
MTIKSPVAEGATTMSQIHFFRGVAAGALAGLAASWVMNQFHELKPIHKPPQSKAGSRQAAPSREPREEQREQKGESDENATVKTAERISRKVFHHELTAVEKKLAGPAVHYAYGSVVGALYGGLAELMPITAAGAGMPFGFALWLLGDEIAVPALGLGKPPTETPAEVHADALAAHFMYGATTDCLRRVFRHIL